MATTDSNTTRPRDEALCLLYDVTALIELARMQIGEIEDQASPSQPLAYRAEVALGAAVPKLAEAIQLIDRPEPSNAPADSAEASRGETRAPAEKKTEPFMGDYYELAHAISCLRDAFNAVVPKKTDAGNPA